MKSLRPYSTVSLNAPAGKLSGFGWGQASLVWPNADGAAAAKASPNSKQIPSMCFMGFSRIFRHNRAKIVEFPLEACGLNPRLLPCAKFPRGEHYVQGFSRRHRHRRPAGSGIPVGDAHSPIAKYAEATPH